MATPVLQHLKHKAFKLQEGEQQQNLPNTQTECRTCTSTSTNPQAVKVITCPQYKKLGATIELIGMVNEADIFVGDIQLLPSFIQEHKSPPLSGTSVKNMGMKSTL